MYKKKNLIIIFGGVSGEHEVSCASASSVLDHINRNKYNISTIGITKEGRWLLTEASMEEIQSGAWKTLDSNREIIINLGDTSKAFSLSIGEEIPCDCVFSILHGQQGEDGTMQGFLEVLGIPYVGPGVLASAVAMDKIFSKKLLGGENIKQAGYTQTCENVFRKDEKKEIERIENLFEDGFPLFVKPANTGSSVGISKAHDREELKAAIEEALKIDKRVLIEETVIGRELEVSVLGNENPQASPVGEIISAKEFYDYEAKYADKGSVTRRACDLPGDTTDRIRESALSIYKELGCRGLARVDFFYTDKDEIYFIEANTLPGFTAISMYPQLWQEAGLEYGDLIDRLIELALEEF